MTKGFIVLTHASNLTGNINRPGKESGDVTEQQRFAVGGRTVSADSAGI